MTVFDAYLIAIPLIYCYGIGIIAIEEHGWYPRWYKDPFNWIWCLIVAVFWPLMVIGLVGFGVWLGLRRLARHSFAGR